MQFDKNAYRVGMELVQDCRDGEIVFGTGKGNNAGDLITKDLDVQQLVDLAARRAGLPDAAALAELRKLCKTVEAIVEQHSRQRFEKAWATYKTSGVMAPPPNRYYD